MASRKKARLDSDLGAVSEGVNVTVVHSFRLSRKFL
jgi:hypothetical protein